jgi:H+-transporting ATPase
MVLIIALLNDGTIMTLSLDRVLPSSTPDSWDLGEIFTFAFAYGIYLAAGTIAFFCVIVYTTFFSRKFGVTNITDHNDPELHMIIYLQVAQISQALIFITRSHSFFFMERPSVALFAAFCLAQLISSIIAAYGDWGFTSVRSISGGWIGIVWIWNIVWFFPLDFVKFGVRAGVRAWNNKRGKHAHGIKPVDGVPITRTQSRHESLYSNRTSFLRRAQRSVGLGRKVSVTPAELQRFSSHQASASGAALRA